MQFFKRTIPIAIALITGAWFAVQYYVPAGWSETSLTKASTWLKILAGFAFALGLYSLCHMHLLRIRRRVPGWGYSLLVYVGLLTALYFGMIGEVRKVFEIAVGPIDTSKGIAWLVFAGWHAFEPGGEGKGYVWLYDHVYNPAQATMFSILAFMIASAAYRTFRARTWEAAVLLVAAGLVMFGRVPLSGLVSDFFPSFADWIMANPQMAAKRGILLGVSLGSIATSLRIIFGIERAYLGGGD